MKHLILMMALTLGLTACESSSDSKKPSGGNETVNNVTDYSVCERGAPASSIEGSWQLNQESESIKMRMVFQIGKNAVRLTNDCSVGSRSLRASVMVPSSYTSNLFSILRADSDTQEIDEAGFKGNCNVSIEKGEMSYRFRGSCLVMSREGQDVTLVPARF